VKELRIDVSFYHFLKKNKFIEIFEYDEDGERYCLYDWPVNEFPDKTG